MRTIAPDTTTHQPPSKLFLKSCDFIPRHGNTKELRDWIKSKLGCEMPIVWSTNLTSETFKRNIENYIGTTQIPLGIAGPLLMRGERANGLYYVPFATTEGLLVDSYNRGMLAISQSGGARVSLLKDHIDISPLFVLKDEVKNFSAFLEKNIEDIKSVVKTKTSHGRLIRYDLRVVNPNHVIVTFYYHTKDAMGLNMINIATDGVCRFIKRSFPIENYYLRSNFSSDKKTSYHNFLSGYGKSVLASVTLPQAIIKNYLGTTIDKIYDFWYWAFISSQQSGMVGINAQFANGLAGIYIATGQDVAQIVNAATGTTIMHREKNHINITVKLPSLVIGTLGGGTQLPSQRECLALMNCLEEGAAQKFSEIVAAAVLAGEVSICAALSAGTFAEAHAKKRAIR